MGTQSTVLGVDLPAPARPERIKALATLWGIAISGTLAIVAFDLLSGRLNVDLLAATFMFASLSLATVSILRSEFGG